MKPNLTSTSLRKALAAALLLGGLGTTASRADILYVTLLGNNTIEKITGAGTGSVFASTGLNGPAGLAFDSAGNLYVANVGDNTIEKFTPGGSGSVFASTGLNFPLGLAFDSAGNLYAANRGNNTIEKFTPGGSASVFATSANGVTSDPRFIAFTNDAGVPLPLANQVPEPTTLALAAMGSFAFLGRKSRRPHRPSSDPAKIAVQ